MPLVVSWADHKEKGKATQPASSLEALTPLTSALLVGPSPPHVCQGCAFACSESVLLILLSRLQAFCPALIVPGIGYSDDKLLQSRIFSYADSQRHRLGPNYLTLPINAPKSNHHNNHHEGFMNMTVRDEEVRCFSILIIDVKA